jgi:hypothetical protein
VVRIGPNVLDLDSPEVMKTVFNTKGDWKKVRTRRFDTLWDVQTDLPVVC